MEVDSTGSKVVELSHKIANPSQPYSVTIYKAEPDMISRCSRTELKEKCVGPETLSHVKTLSHERSLFHKN